MYIFAMRVVNCSGSKDDPCIWYLQEQDDLKWNGISECQSEIKTEPLNVDLKYQQSEPEFCEKPEAKVIQLLCYSANCLCTGGGGGGGLLYVGIFSLIFWRE